MDYLAIDHPTRELICGLCRQFYTLGWASGTGGGIAIKHPTLDQILVAPSGVQKERLHRSDLFVVNLEGEVLQSPLNPTLTLSQCWPLFQHAFVKRGAGAIIHSHQQSAVLASLYTGVGRFELRGDFCEMVKGLRGKGYHDSVVIPVINNTAHECDLADSLGDAMDRHPDVDAVLVRSHGIYVWGSSWQQAKTQAECFDYLFKLYDRLNSRDWNGI